jgi:hypothetical protein
VSTLIISQIPINKGTCTTSQVDNVAGFFPPVAVSHFSQGGVSITSSSTLGSNSIFIGFQLYSCKTTFPHSTKKNLASQTASLFMNTCS